MSRFFLRGVSFIALVTLVLAMGCGEDDPAGTSIPKLTTTAITDITTSSAESGGTITSDGGEEIVIRGVCWSTTPDPTVADDKTTNGAGSDDFTSTLTDLESNTTYFVRAYASNANGTGYGNSVSFTTGTITLATVTTTALTKVKVLTAESGGAVTADGGGEITARGVCWSTTENPTIANSKTTDGVGTGAFVSQPAGLMPNTTYYLRAYATNTAGTAYGNQFEFLTNDEYSGVYEVVTGSVFRGLIDGSADPLLSGNYEVGLVMEMNKFGEDTVQLYPMYINAGIAGLDPTLAIIDRSVTSPDGSHPVKIICLANETLRNIPGTESKFFPGDPGTSGITEKQAFVLNFEWQLGALNRNVTNLRIKFKVNFNGD
jgi:hypothetical protein